MSDDPGVPAGGGDQRALVARLRAVIEAKDTEIAVLRAELDVAGEQSRRLELRVAELERRLGSDSTNSGVPPSKDPIGARERRKAERKKDRQSSERERRKDRKRGGQPGHPGAGLSRDPDPDERTEVPPPSGSPTTGTVTGTTATTPATRSAAGCATTPTRSGCSPASSPSSGRTIRLHIAPLVAVGESGGWRAGQVVVVLVVPVSLGGLTFFLGVRGRPDLRWGLRRPER